LVPPITPESYIYIVYIYIYIHINIALGDYKKFCSDEIYTLQSSRVKREQRASSNHAVLPRNKTIFFFSLTKLFYLDVSIYYQKLSARVRGGLRGGVVDYVGCVWNPRRSDLTVDIIHPIEPIF
jgi:hypothetical protein